MQKEMVDVPFADLHQQYLSIKLEIDSAIADVISNSAFIRGPFVEAFENEFAMATGAKHCVSCANGTDSLYIAMRALEVKAGDEVIVPAMSWISTSETVSQAGAKVVFCDIDPDTYTIDVTKLESLITSRTVGVIPVHLYGQPAAMITIMQIAKKYNLWVIEDCAQAHLAKHKGQLVGSFGTAASYSFYPGKNLGAMGDAGAITTQDSKLAERMAMFARHGGIKKGDHQIEGINSRLDGLQASILSVKLKYLDTWTEMRGRVAAQFISGLKNVKNLKVPVLNSENRHVWHLFVIQHEQREQLIDYLKANNIQTAINYPLALPFLPCYSHMTPLPGDFPVAYQMQSRILSLPIFPEITQRQIQHLLTSIISFEDQKKQ